MTPDEIVAAYQAGGTVAAIAKRSRRSTAWVRRILDDRGMQRRGRWGTPLDHDQVIAEYLAGASAAEIAREHGRSATWIAAILRQHDVRRRTRWDDLQPVDVEDVARDYLSGDSLQVVARRYHRSMTWVRTTLARMEIPRRPRGGTYKDVSDELIVQLRDVACLSWEEIGSQVEMTPDSVAIRYASAPGRLPHERYNFAGGRTDVTIWLRNDAANHRDEIIAAYLTGQSSEALARVWGISARTILRWVAKALPAGMN